MPEGGPGRIAGRLVGFLLRLVLWCAGLMLVASLAVVLLLVAGLWALRAGWARLTGRPVAPFVMRFAAGDAFSHLRRVYRAPASRFGAAAPRAAAADVIDVQAREKLPGEP